jgi:hypothetical protein
MRADTSDIDIQPSLTERAASPIVFCVYLDPRNASNNAN